MKRLVVVRRLLPSCGRSAHGAGLAVIGLAWTGAHAGATNSPATRPAAVSAVSTDAERVVDRNLALKDVAGVERQPLACGPGVRAAVVFFLATECPISNGYSPEINRISAAFAADKRVTMSIVHPLADLKADDARKHAAEFGYTVPVFVDADQAVSRAVGATVTPEVAVVSADGTILYRGRIDDRWATYGKQRVEPTVRDLRDAIEAALAGKPIPTARTKAIGCPI